MGNRSDYRSPKKALLVAIMRAFAIASLIAALGLYACTERAPPPAPVAMPAPRLPTVAPTPPPVAQTGNWEDWPATPGNWAYRQDARGSLALFGPQGTDAQFLIRCDRQAQRIYASRAGAFPAGESGRMTIRASSGLQTYAVANTEGGASYVAAEIMPNDRHLDAMAYSRGRFVVSVKGSSDLVVPSWAELTRVIEDCRG